ncbi:hypothetical protein RvY_12818-2 [Ramazzottius varieornatus]|uniref:Uncharacterized protein n=1 Tax=Ramazzottius varieornatus TaxID=947166 RepID=A0A1D1VKT0_RAMVA|nr:hypothetical protein RvY_12818-2 [Ramazzottius varieornatus]
MSEAFRSRPSHYSRNRESFVHHASTVRHQRRASQLRLPPFNAEKEAIEFFYRREKTNPSLPARILEQVFGSDFVDRLAARGSAMRKRTCTPNQYEDLCRQIRVYQRHILSCEMFYTRTLALLPPKAFAIEKVSARPRISIFGPPSAVTNTRRHSTMAGPGKTLGQKFRLAYFPGGFGHLTKGGKKVAPIDQEVPEDLALLKQTLNILREDHNPNAPVNLVKYNQKTGMITEEENISQSEIVFLQVGTKLHVNSARGKAVLEERAQRFPVVDGKQLPGPRKRYNYIESVFRPQQIWQRQSRLQVRLMKCQL